ncbi:hypothetical protein J6590_097168 [Homalodisca vitripennis]|nr:hypothetical protein J6590_097168 [Homalodisca vitripennis]
MSLFGFESLSLRRDVMEQMFLRGLVQGRVDSAEGLGVISFRVPSFNSRGRLLFGLPHVRTVAHASSPLLRMYVSLARRYPKPTDLSNLERSCSAWPYTDRELESLLRDLNNLQLNYVLMGDFNVDEQNITHPTSTIRLIDTLRSFCFELLVKSPTRETPTTQTTIDIIVSNITKVVVSVVNTANSDHYGQEAIIMGKQIEREHKITKIIRDTRLNNIALLNVSLSKEQWNLLNFTEPDEAEVAHEFNGFLHLLLVGWIPGRLSLMLPKREDSALQHL